jgi:STE24 endopeptidase
LRRGTASAKAAGCLLITGWSAALRDLAVAVAGASFPLTVVIYVTVIAVLSEIVQLPLAFYQGVTLERRYELSTQTTVRWWRDRVKAGGIALVFAVIGALIVGRCCDQPEFWWLAAALLRAFVPPQLGMWLLPLFYKITPLQRPALAERLVALAARAGARVLGVFEWRLSDRTRKANAALTGIGRTRRILLSDTLLAEHSDDEIEIVLAHELAHHVHHDIWTAMALETALIMLGFYMADRVLGACLQVGY